MAKAGKRSSYNRSYYQRNRKKILAKMRRYYSTKRSKILTYQRKYRRRTKAGTKAYKPLYMRGGGGKRPLYARLPRLNAYRFIGRKRGKTSKALGRRSAGFKAGVRRKPRGAGRAFATTKK